MEDEYFEDQYSKESMRFFYKNLDASRLFDRYIEWLNSIQKYKEHKDLVVKWHHELLVVRDMIRETSLKERFDVLKELNRQKKFLMKKRKKDNRSISMLEKQIDIFVHEFID